MNSNEMKQPASLARRGLQWQLAELADAQTIYELESSSYPADEAASLENIQMRIAEAGDYFVCVYEGSALVGFVNGTCAAEGTLDHDSMSSHVPGGPTLCIHSVCVSHDHRRKGIATTMLKAYVQFVAQAHSHLERILLLSKGYLLSFYTSCGFRVHGISPVVHGAESWFELGVEIAQARAFEMLQIDAFTTTVFAGNSAAVTFTHNDDNSEWMQKVAMENNLAETAFLEALPEISHYHLRWFSPFIEEPICGHATLASAHALFWTQREQPEATIHFHTLAGELLANRWTDGTIELDFPAKPPTETELSQDQLTALSACLGITSNDITWVGHNEYDLVACVTMNAFKSLKPAFNPQIECIQGRCVHVTAVSDTSDEAYGTYNYVCRVFALDATGIEDPVTGSCHCAIAPFWGKRLNLTSLTGYQASQRGGIVRTKLITTSDNSGAAEDRVKLIGNAVTVLEGKFLC